MNDCHSNKNENNLAIQQMDQRNDSERENPAEVTKKFDFQ